ncbi:Bro-N domain-containing protein [Mammaliicoccus vitulinus]|uniref:BRO-N domain-containing protein n=1 Tax=Mammaliicoccus vitulinus TaxID=71237 RepID=UPI002B2594E3|nr:Bro-N domain-containing protein [Mammaliicoccus vitulinus]WQK87075.1 Bro-N domain-containing protein [Mammaliicoccus vitulinus]
MNELQIFNFDSNEVRTVVVNEEPHFVGKDVAKILGYKNTREALKYHVDNEDKKDGVAIHDSIGRKQKPVFINESGLYSLIFSSKLDSSKRFKRWVTSEVLPQLRRSGTYSANPTIQEIANNPQLVQMMVEQIAKLNDSQSGANNDLAYLKDAVTGEYVTPQDLIAIKHVIANKAEKFVDNMGIQLSLEDMLIGDVYEIAKENKRRKQQRNNDVGLVKRKILVATKKYLGMKGNAPNNQIKRKNSDLAIQFIKDIRPSQIEI